MARINAPTKLQKSFHLNAREEKDIKDQIKKYSPAYLVNKPERITVKLNYNGRQSYKNRLFSRPERIKEDSTIDTYVFDCTRQQIFDYFLPFGKNAEIISPEDLRNEFAKRLSDAAEIYK
jgi:predicted DNA-binding transcriptional regulator YafY